MGFTVYNDLGRTKQEFVPIQEGRVRFYVCGPTVYDYFHIGNARPFIVFDVMRRYLEHIGYEVTYVQNFTDIDDKMIRRAAEMGITVAELGERYMSAYFEDADALGVRRASVHPKATEEMEQITDIIEKLIAKGHAYEVDGDVYFSVGSYSGYGKLSHQSPDELVSGARVDVDDRKKNPLDFALWKAQKPGEPAWESPWGAGRPGWHIECSAMSQRYLGDTIDFHGGGSDLMFPHHENEIAQSEAANGVPFVNYWVHNGYLMIDREKMSKSLGNFLTAREALAQYPPLAIRMFMLSAHYRSPINFSPDLLRQAQTAQERIANGWAELSFALENRPGGRTDEALRHALDEGTALFTASMDDDLNTAGAMGAVFDVVRAVNTSLGENGPADMEALGCAEKFLRDVDKILGVVGIKAAVSLDEEVERLIAERKDARASKNFARSDEIRDTLSAMGITLEDTPQGTRWKKS